MNNADHLSEDDLALFALQLFNEQEQESVVAHLEECEDCRVKVAEVQGDLVAYAMTAEMHSPPAAARDRLLRQVQREKKLVPVDKPIPQIQPETQTRTQPAAASEPVLVSRNSTLFAEHIDDPAQRRSMPFLGWAGWAIAAGVTIVAGVQFHQRQLAQQNIAELSQKLQKQTEDPSIARAAGAMKTLTDSGALQVSLHLPPPDGTKDNPLPEAHVGYIPTSGSLVLIADHLKPLPDYKTYELWVLPADGHDPIPAGIFKPNANGSATLVLPDVPKGVPASGFGVTIEDDGGSKTPTKPVVLVGTI